MFNWLNEEESGLHRGHIVISLGYAHGQDLAAPSARKMVSNLIKYTKPEHAFVAWPCGPYSRWNVKVNMQRSKQLRDQIEKQQRQSKKNTNFSTNVYSST